MQEFRVSIKGPLTTPVGGGIRSLNVTLRQVLDLYACIRPVRYFEGVGAPVKEPEKVEHRDLPREHGGRLRRHRVEGGIARSGEARARICARSSRARSARSPRIGIKPMSEFGSKRLVEMAIRYAIAKCKESVTLVHKGNIMKFTEGAFRDWGYEVAREKFPDDTLHRSRAGQGRTDGARRCDRDARPHRGLDVPAAAAAARRNTR